jgi:hypothetical protein
MGSGSRFLLQFSCFLPAEVVEKAQPALQTLKP